MAESESMNAKTVSRSIWLMDARTSSMHLERLATDMLSYVTGKSELDSVT